MGYFPMGRPNLRGEIEDLLTVSESCQCLDSVDLVPVGRISVSPPLIWRKFGQVEFGVIGKAAEMNIKLEVKVKVSVIFTSQKDAKFGLEMNPSEPLPHSRRYFYKIKHVHGPAP